MLFPFFSIVSPILAFIFNLPRLGNHVFITSLCWPDHREPLQALAYELVSKQYQVTFAIPEDCAPLVEAVDGLHVLSAGNTSHILRPTLTDHELYSTRVSSEVTALVETELVMYRHLLQAALKDKPDLFVSTLSSSLCHLIRSPHTLLHLHLHLSTLSTFPSSLSSIVRSFSSPFSSC